MAFKRVIIRRVGPLSWLLGIMENTVSSENKSASYRNFDIQVIEKERKQLLLSICFGVLVLFCGYAIPSIMRLDSEITKSITVVTAIVYFALLIAASFSTSKLGKELRIPRIEIQQKIVIAFIFPLFGLAILSSIYSAATEELRIAKRIRERQ